MYSRGINRVIFYALFVDTSERSRGKMCFLIGIEDELVTEGQGPWNSLKLFSEVTAHSRLMKVLSKKDNQSGQ